MTKEEGDSYVGKVYPNKSRWNKDGKKFVKVIAYDCHNQRFYTQDVVTGRVDWVNNNGKGEWYECGGIWLIIDLNNPHYE